jgi:DNA-binding MarR family transcriptional regulator
MTERSDEFWAVVSYVQMSKNRRQVLHHLDKADRPLTPTELSKRLHVAFNSASRAVRQLADKDLVTCLNPDAPRYRRYRLTDTGRSIWRTIQELDDTDNS